MTYLVVRPELVKEAMFKNTDVQISTIGQRHVGAVFGTNMSEEAYATQKWANELVTMHDVIGRWLYLC